MIQGKYILGAGALILLLFSYCSFCRHSLLLPYVLSTTLHPVYVLIIPEKKQESRMDQGTYGISCAGTRAQTP